MEETKQHGFNLLLPPDWLSLAKRKRPEQVHLNFYKASFSFEDGACRRNPEYGPKRLKPCCIRARIAYCEQDPSFCKKPTFGRILKQIAKRANPRLGAQNRGWKGIGHMVFFCPFPFALL